MSAGDLLNRARARVKALEAEQSTATGNVFNGLNALSPDNARARRAALIGELTALELQLEGMAPDEQRRAKAFQRHRAGLRAYEAFCRAFPKQPEHVCLDCRRPSRNSLTPCDDCMVRRRG